jgi:uncharacterized membrane protein
MTRISETIEIRKPLVQVFNYGANYRNATKFISSVTCYEPTSETARGVGARFAMEITIQDFRFTQEVEVVELQENKLLTVRSISGQPFSEASWRFAATPHGTQVGYEILYTLPDVFLGRKINEAARRQIDKQIRADVKQSLAKLKSQMEGPEAGH